MVSAKECTASASMAPDPENTAAISLVTAIPKLASIAATIARLPPLVLTWPTYTFEHDRLFAPDRDPRSGFDGWRDPVWAALARCACRGDHRHQPHGGQGGGPARVHGGPGGCRVARAGIRPGCDGHRTARRPTRPVGCETRHGARAARRHP